MLHPLERPLRLHLFDVVCLVQEQCSMLDRKQNPSSPCVDGFSFRGAICIRTDVKLQSSPRHNKQNICQPTCPRRRSPASSMHVNIDDGRKRVDDQRRANSLSHAWTTWRRFAPVRQCRCNTAKRAQKTVSLVKAYGCSPGLRVCPFKQSCLTSH